MTGNSGNVTIITGQLSVTDDAQVTVRNDGTGDAGKLEIKANSIRLDDKAGITASTQSGKGGNISINSRDLLLLRHNSQISAEARGAGDGGNITINSPFIIAVPTENSDIIANAFRGRGGNINITTQGIFGIQPRNQNTPQSDITASSQLGINGTVQVDTPDTNPSQGLVVLLEELVDATRLIAQGCTGRGSNVGKEPSEFIITGRGGLPPNQPGEPLSAEALVDDEDMLEAGGENRLAKVTTSTPSNHSTHDQMVEAQGWVINAQGQVVLTAQPPSATSYSSASTQTTCYVR